MPEVGCYSMDLYCDHENDKHGDFPAIYTGHTRTSCKKQAKKDGWRWHSNGAVACPLCKGKPE